MRSELRQARAALEEFRNRYFEAYHLAPVGFFTLGETGLIQQANLTGASQLGVDRADLVGVQFSEFVDPPELERWRSMFRVLVRPGEWLSFRLAIRRRDGTILHSLLAADGRSGPHGRPEVWFAATDIGEQVRTEAGFRAYVENAPIALFVLDGRGRFVDCNPAGASIVGVDAATLKAMAIGDFLDPRERSTVARDFRHLVATRALDQKYGLLRRDGAKRWIRVRAVKLTEDRYAAFCEDVTGMAEAEEALRESENRFRLLAARAPVGIVQIGPKGQVVYANPAFLEMTGLDETEARLPGSGTKVIHPDDRERVLREWRRALSAGLDFAGDCRIQARDGRTRWVRGYGTPLRSDAGDLLGYVGVLARIPAPRKA